MLTTLSRSTTTGLVIKNTLTHKPYQNIEGEERKIEGTQGNTPNKIKTLRQLTRENNT